MPVGRRLSVNLRQNRTTKLPVGTAAYAGVRTSGVVFSNTSGHTQHYLNTFMLNTKLVQLHLLLIDPANNHLSFRLISQSTDLRKTSIIDFSVHVHNRSIPVAYHYLQQIVLSLKPF